MENKFNYVVDKSLDSCYNGFMVELKLCPSCGDTKIAKEFCKRVASSDGLGPTCKLCRNARRRELHKKNPIPLREQGRKWKRNNREKYILKKAKESAKKRNLDFSITVDDFSIPVNCPVLGMKLDLEVNERTDASPSIDRIDSNLGYIKGNVRIISWRANDLKKDASVWELELVLEDLRECQRDY